MWLLFQLEFTAIDITLEHPKRIMWFFDIKQSSLHFSLSCIGEGNGNPLQCPCLENPRDGGAWWAAVYGVAQNRTRLKRFSSSSSRDHMYNNPKEIIKSLLKSNSFHFSTDEIFYLVEDKSMHV